MANISKTAEIKQDISVVVDFTETKITVDKKIERDLFWFDPLRNVMNKFVGGQLIYEYRLDPWLVNLSPKERQELRIDERGYKSNYRLLPKVTELKEKRTNKSDNKQQVIEWFKHWLNYNNTRIEIIGKSDKRFVFKVPEKEYEDFIDELDRKSFKHWKQ